MSIGSVIDQVEVDCVCFVSIVNHLDVTVGYTRAFDRVR